MTVLEQQGMLARQASRVLASTGTNLKNAVLESISGQLIARKDEIISANARDLEQARETGIPQALLDRLTLTAKRIAEIAEGVSQVAALPDPIGQVTEMRTLANGLIVGRKRVPLGVIGIIYEARPNVTVDAAALCLKAGNAVILRGGKEAIESNTALVGIMRDTLEKSGLPRDCISLVANTTRKSAEEMMKLTGYLDVLIPRGGAGLIRSVVENARVPVIETGVGICHIYVHRDASLPMAAQIIQNAKCSRPSVCNAAEGLLVDRAVAAEFLPKAKELLDQYGVELRGCPETRSILGAGVTLAGDRDYDTEFLDFILAVKVVDGPEEAIQFIHDHGSGHSEAIVTENYSVAQRFLNEVDAAAVYVNASTRFTDGFEFGLGAEIGISTQRLHARGPMGLEALTSGKYIIYGSGQVRG